MINIQYKKCTLFKFYLFLHFFSYYNSHIFPDAMFFNEDHTHIPMPGDTTRS